MKFHHNFQTTLLLIIIFLAFSHISYCQEYLMQNGSVSTCSGNFYDSGGPNDDSGNNEDLVFTICPDVPDFKLILEFTQLEIISFIGDEEFTIYDGPDTTGSILAVLEDLDSIGPGDPSLKLVASENNSSGCLTIRYISNPFLNGPGWNAIISCFEGCEDTTASIVDVSPSTFNTTTNNYEVGLFHNIEFEIDPAFPNYNGSDASYLWNFGDGTTVLETSSPFVTHIFEDIGEYVISVSIIDDFGCLNDNILQIPVVVVQLSGSYCSEARKICLDDSIIIIPNFNSFNEGLLNAETGPDYGCLALAPYPSWFYFEVEESGDIAFLLEQSDTPIFSDVSLDLDFKIWGPFTSPFGNCENLNSSTELPDLPNGNLFDGCSYSVSGSENMGVQNATSGEYYVFVAANFSGQVGFIRIRQINESEPNSGSTGCNVTEFLGDDILACSTDNVTITSSIDNADSYVWEIFNAPTNSFQVIPNEENNTLVANEPGGAYRCTVTTGVSTVQDEIIVTFFEEPIVNSVPNDIQACKEDNDVQADLTLNDLLNLDVANPTNFEIYYFESLSDANSGDVSLAIPPDQINNYTVPEGTTTLFIRIQNIDNPNCYTIEPFDVVVLLTPEVEPQPDLIICDDGDDGFEIFDLTVMTPGIVSNLQNATVSFYETENDAFSNVNPIANPSNYGNTTNPQTIYFRVEQLDNFCITVDSFDLVVDDCLNLNENTITANDLIVYPIPSYNDIIYVKSKMVSNLNTKLIIVDLNGRLVYQQSMTLNSEEVRPIYLSSLSSGTYLAIIEVNKSTVINKIILK